VLASRLFGQLTLSIAQALLENMMPVLPKGGSVMLLVISRLVVGFAARVMIPNVTLPIHQAYLVVWITALDIVQRMTRPAAAAIWGRLRKNVYNLLRWPVQVRAPQFSARRSELNAHNIMVAPVGPTRSPNSSLSVTQRAELDAHRVLTLMVAKNLSIVAALIISVFFRALNGIDVFSRALVPIFAMQLVLSCVSDVLCVFMEIRYLRLDLAGVAEAYYLDWRAILAPCLVAIFLGGNILSPLYLQVFDLQNSG
jgi:hypothetical protein